MLFLTLVVMGPLRAHGYSSSGRPVRHCLLDIIILFEQPVYFTPRFLTRNKPVNLKDERFVEERLIPF